MDMTLASEAGNPGSIPGGDTFVSCMTFNSALFLVFFPLVTFLYFVTPHRWRWATLLIASCYFYMCFVPVYIFILAFTIGVDYVAGIYIEKAVGLRRKWLLVVSILVNVGVLFGFKYIAFALTSINNIAGWLYVDPMLAVPAILLPIGLSFHTFQSLSYTIEVYRGNQSAERHLGIFALYVMFYPQLVAGPIERPQRMLHQFKEEHRFSWGQLGEGLRLMIWGFFMKVVIADRLAFFVNEVFGGVQAFRGPSFVVAIVFFAFQIYCDFAGYSLIALGSAKSMGFDLMQNFNRPYTATSVADFWKRWHMSLSSWFRDYVYIPLGGNRVVRWKIVRNVLTTFLLSGLWHGAGWTYVIWGLLNGMYLVVGEATATLRAKVSRVIGLTKRPRVQRFFQRVITFGLVCFAWLFFRVNSLQDIQFIFANFFVGWDVLANHLSNEAILFYMVYVGQPKIEFILAIAGIGTLLTVEWWRGHRETNSRPALSSWLSWAVCVITVFLIFLLGEFKAQQFIYFQF